MSEPRIIKKYPNRRLYDTEVSSYVTLEDVRNLVLQEIPFQIRDARTNEDLTRSILLQIIMEQGGGRRADVQRAGAGEESSGPTAIPFRG